MAGLFARGFGHDVLQQNDSGTRQDIVKFTDLNSTDLDSFARIGTDLVARFTSGDQLTLKNFYYSDSWWEYKINQIQFADGTTWDQTQIKANTAISGTAGDDNIVGLSGVPNNIRGEAGDDSITGAAADDTLDGGDGNDILNGDGGDDTLLGGAGNDMLDSSAGNDVLTGGAGNDTLNGGSGSDTFLFARGFGQDVLQQNDSGARQDIVKFTDLNSTDLDSFARIGADLVARFASGDQLTLKNFYYSDSWWEYKINQIQFADGISWDQTQIKARTTTLGTANNDTINGYNGAPNDIQGLAGNDTLVGGDNADRLDGGDGDDNLTGEAGDDTLAGGVGTDILDSGGGNDVLIGGAGNDTLNGGSGSDTFLFERGFGQDVLQQNDNGTRQDIVKFTDLNSTDLDSFARIGTDLVAHFTSGDQLTLKNFYYSDSWWEYKINQIQFADGTTWDQGQIKANTTEQIVAVIGVQDMLLTPIGS